MQFIDLNRQYENIKSVLNANMQQVIKSKQFIMGPEIQELEEKLSEYCGRKYCLTCASGTDALLISLMAFGVHDTDAIFVPSFTFYATAESVSLAGGIPVFVDSDTTFNMDPASLRRAIEKVKAEGKLRPRGVIPVDLFGLSAKYDEILHIAEEYDLFVLEDAAQGFGGRLHGKRNGSFGQVSTTSFFPAKPLGCYGDGGAIFTDDDDLYELMSSIRIHGRGKNQYDNVRIGMNGRMDTLQAAVLLAKLTVFEEEIHARQHVAQAYMQCLKGNFELPVVPEGYFSAWAQFTLMAEDEAQRDKIVRIMKKENIPIMIYYPIPMHMQQVYRNLGYADNDLPICMNMAKRVFSVPMHAYLREEEVKMISEKLIKAMLNV